MDFLERGFTILVVEDQAFIASEFNDAVRRNGGRVLGPATRVSEALALIESARCDGALLDVHVGMGERVFEHLRKG
jgi:DNA-binding NarL/FixJ family response regulator